jgi:5-methyltetrahydrofolate--homocysteine methyltransferase
VPKFIGRRVFKNFDLGELAPYIDWAPFFQTWDLAGPFPAILDDAVVGVEARRVYADGQAMLKKIVDGRWLTANAVVGLYPANSVDDDDIAFYLDESRTGRALTWYGLRQQTEKPVVDGLQMPSRCLADFVAPRNTPQGATNSGAAYAYPAGSAVQKDIKNCDYAGLFAVTAGMGADKRAQAFEAAHDDYSSILLKSLADRLAEAFAERLHQKVRTDLWGYAAQESLGTEELIVEKYQGIRPAPGYPACPDHSAKQDLFAVLQCEEVGMGLTTSLAMTPAASVSGFYIAHPESTYFSVGKIGDDQLQDLARRRGVPVADLQRLLAPNL